MGAFVGLVQPEFARRAHAAQKAAHHGVLADFAARIRVWRGKRLNIGIVQHLIRLTLPDADAVTASGALPEPGSVDQVAYRVQSRRAQDFVAAALRASGQVTPRAAAAATGTRSDTGGADSGAGASSRAAASNTPGAETQPEHQLSTADELVKLADLHERGLLSAEEFATAKAKVLE